MELLNNITDQIQSNLTSNFHVRANYLYSLCLPEIMKAKNKKDYLDMGCGYGINSEVFGERFENLFCSDLSKMNLVKCQEYMKRVNGVFFTSADAQSLPFKNECFDMVTAFSLIEHVPHQEKMVKEAMRILKKKGIFIMQFPNKNFFMELHTGFPLYCLIPDIARPWILKKLKYTDLLDINLPDPEQIKKMVLKADTSAKVRFIKVVYPDELVPPRFKKIYSIIKRTGIFNHIPFGWIVLCKKMTCDNPE